MYLIKITYIIILIQYIKVLLFKNIYFSYQQ